MELRLKADTKQQKLILRYLQDNVSEALAERINAGKKTLDDCCKFITGEARKQAIDGCACIEDREVYGWAVHFFEEDGIKVGHESPSASTEKTAGKEVKSHASKSNPVYEQLSFFAEA